MGGPPMVMKCLAACGALIAGPAIAQVGVTYAPRAYPSYEEALRHLLPVLAGCLGIPGLRPCQSGFSLEAPHGPVPLLWRPTKWVHPPPPLKLNPAR